MNLPFTRKEVEYLRNLIEQEKLRLIEDISSLEARANHTDNQKLILKKVVSKNYFDVAAHVGKMRGAITVLKRIEAVIYPE